MMNIVLTHILLYSCILNIVLTCILLYSYIYIVNSFSYIQLFLLIFLLIGSAKCVIRTVIIIINDYSKYNNTNRDRGATLRLRGGGGGTISDSILGGHKTLFLTKSL